MDKPLDSVFYHVLPVLTQIASWQETMSLHGQYTALAAKKDNSMQKRREEKLEFALWTLVHHEMTTHEQQGVSKTQLSLAQQTLMTKSLGQHL